MKDITSNFDLAKSDYLQIAKALMADRIEIENLDIKNPTHFNGITEALKNNDYLYSLKFSNIAEKKAIVKWVFENKDRFGRLKVSQYFEELLKAYCEYILDSEIRNRQKPYKDIALSVGYNKDMAFACKYESREGESICLFDKNLNLAIDLAMNIDFSANVVSYEKMLKHVNVDVASISMKAIARSLFQSLANSILEIIPSYFVSKNVSFYDLGTVQFEIASILNAKFANACADYGVEISNFYIRTIKPLSTLAEELEKLRLASIAEIEKKRAEIAYQEVALANYEKKAEIHAKYPNFAFTLTEAEKDNAMTRHMKISGSYQKTEELDLQKEDLQKVNNSNVLKKATLIEEPVEIEEVKSKLTFAQKFALIGLGVVVASIICFVISITFGIFATIAMVAVYAFFFKKGYDADKLAKETRAKLLATPTKANPTDTANPTTSTINPPTENND